MSSKQISGLIDEQYIEVSEGISVEEAIDEVRTHTPERERTVYYVYVTDDSGGLSGVVSLRELLNTDGGATVSEIMTEEVVTVAPTDSASSVAKTLASSSFNALPVVEQSGEFRGIVRANDVLDALDEETTKDILKQGREFSPFGD